MVGEAAKCESKSNDSKHSLSYQHSYVTQTLCYIQQQHWTNNY